MLRHLLIALVSCACLFAQVPDSKKLEVSHSEKPVYPKEAKKKHLEGPVLVQFEVDETGNVVGAESKSGDPILAAAALDAIKKWKFKPFLRDGKAIRIRGEMPFMFGTGKYEIETTGPDGNPRRMVVEAGVSEGLLVHRVNPEYPSIARASRVQGAVVMKAVIGTDGSVKDIQVVSGHKMLIDAAVDAVKQWKYKPFLKDNVPMEVDTTITVNFSLAGG